MNKSMKNYIKKNINSEETNDTISDNINNDILDNSENSDDVIIMSNELNKKKNDLYKNNVKKNKKRHELSENKNKTINKIILDVVINFN